MPFSRTVGQSQFKEVVLLRISGNGARLITAAPHRPCNPRLRSPEVAGRNNIPEGGDELSQKSQRLQFSAHQRPARISVLICRPIRSTPLQRCQSSRLRVRLRP
jgi:hypothetical protein